MNNRGVISLWTKTPHFKLRRSTLLVQTLALNLAALAFAETHFVTDNLGAELAREFHWPISEITTELEHWPTQGQTHIWALGKLVACAVQTKPFVQFDGDVLLLQPLPEELRAAPLIAQSPDNPFYYSSEDMRRALNIAGLPYGNYAFNAGILGGNDVPLVRAYAWASLELAQKFKDNPINGTSTSMMIEQYFLGVFARRVGVEVATLLPQRPTAEQLNLRGYRHLVGSAKYDERWLREAEEKMKRDFPLPYEIFCAACERYALLPEILRAPPVNVSSDPFVTPFA